MLRTIMRAAACAMLAVIFTGANAQAQLGSLIKKAREKIEAKAESKVKEKAGIEDESVAASAKLAGDPVSAPDLDAIIKGLTYELKAREQADKLSKVVASVREDWRVADSIATPDGAKYRAANERIMDCVNESLAKSEDEHQEAIAEKMMTLMSDPNAQQFIKDYTDVSQRFGAAAQKGDTASARRLLGQMMRVLGVDLVKDSVVAFKKCGKLPAMPATYAKALRLQKQLQDANEDLRKVEIPMFEKAAAQGGMHADKYLLARERVMVWMGERNQKGGSKSLTKDEDALFKSRLADIKKVESAFK